MNQWLCFLLVCFTGFAHSADNNTLIYKIDEKPFEGYFRYDPANQITVMLIHDWNGLTDYEIKRSEILFNLGYNVFAVDMFGQNVRPQTIEDKKKCTGELNQDRLTMRKRMSAALELIQSYGIHTKQVVAAGYCFGGSAVLELARSGADLKGFASFHGGLTTPEGQNYSECKGTVLVFHGAADANISMDDFSALSQEMEKANIKYEMIAYGGAQHSFTVFDDERYQDRADTLSWDYFIDFLSQRES